MKEDLKPQPWLIPQDLYDKLMALPPGTDITEYFEFEPGWDLKVTTGLPTEGETSHGV